MARRARRGQGGCLRGSPQEHCARCASADTLCRPLPQIILALLLHRDVVLLAGLLDCDRHGRASRRSLDVAGEAAEYHSRCDAAFIRSRRGARTRQRGHVLPAHGHLHRPAHRFHEHQCVHLSRSSRECALTRPPTGPANRDVALGAKKGLFIVDLQNPYDPPRYLPHQSAWEVADVQVRPLSPGLVDRSASAS